MRDGGRNGNRHKGEKVVECRFFMDDDYLRNA